MEAFELYKKAAEKGNSHGQHGLATMYYNGIGTPKNVPEAIRWWRKAAEHGLAAAQVDLAFTLRQNEEYKEALRWYQRVLVFLLFQFDCADIWTLRLQRRTIQAVNTAMGSIPFFVRAAPRPTIDAPDRCTGSGRAPRAMKRRPSLGG